MADDRTQQPAAKTNSNAADNRRQNEVAREKAKVADKKPENTFEGDGSPGLTISGGGGHA